MKAESSATTTRRGVDESTVVSLGREVDAGEDALGVEQDDEAVGDLCDRVDEVGAGAGHGVELLALHREHFLDLVDDDARGAAVRLDDHDLRLLRELSGEAEARAEVADRDDLAAKAGPALDPSRFGGDCAGLGVADDLLDLRDRERVFLVSEREDDELLRELRGG